MATQDPGKRLENARAANRLSLAKAWAPVEAALGVLGCSMQQIRNYETGAVPEDEWNPLVIQVLAKTYGVSIKDLSSLAAERTGKVLVLLGGRVDAGRAEDSGGTPPSSQLRESRTLSNRTGSGRNRGGGRGPVQPDFPHNPEHPGFEIAN